MKGPPRLFRAADESRYRRTRRRASGLTLVALVALAGCLGWLLTDHYQRALALAQERAGARADLVVQWVANTFDSSEERLQGLARLLESPLRHPLLARQGRDSALDALLHQRRNSLGIIEALSIYDAEGRRVASSHVSVPAAHEVVGLAGCHARGEPAGDGHRVSLLEPSGADGQYRLMDIHRLEDAAGHCSGLVVAQLDPAVFGETLERLGMARGESIALLDTALRLVARRPAPVGPDAPPNLGRTVDSNELRAFLASGEAHGHARMVSPLDGRERLYALRRVNDLPLVVVIGEELAVILAGWWQRLWVLGVGYLLVAGLGLLLLRHYLHLRRLDASLRIAALAFDTHLGMLITDARGRILKVNRTFTRITGYREQEVVGRSPRMLGAGRHDAAFYRRLWRRVKRRGSWQGEIWNRRRSGEVFPQWLTLSAVRDRRGRLTHYVATFSDISRRKAAEQEIHQLAFFDPLTGLPNRRLLLDRLQDALKNSRRNGQFGALLYLDLDNFKQVNDTRGHHQGDALLQHIARQLEGVLRDSDTLARLGGDEFAVLLQDLGQDPEAVERVAERVTHKLLGVLQTPDRLGAEPLALTGSIGVTLFRDPGGTLDEVLQQADMALFQAKQAGRNTLSFFDPAIQARVQARARLEADLQQALPRGQLRLHYQPQVDADGRMTGLEALLRWAHPERGMVPPGEFIPLAEESRQIVAIGDWVLEAACHQLARWAREPAMARLGVSVNVSPQQFQEPDFVERVEAILASTGAPARRLKLEVTETLFVHDRDDARDKMLRLKARGVTFALDDFGTGYSSLAYLKRLPLDQLKVDQSFVHDLLEEEASAAIVASTIALAQALGLDVIAEGVECEAQRAWLAAHGCRAFQGELFGRPVPAAELMVAMA